MRTGTGQATRLVRLTLPQLLKHMFYTVCAYDERKTKAAKEALAKQIREVGYRCGIMPSDAEINEIITHF